MGYVNVDFDALAYQTDDAYKLRIEDWCVWIPKAVCRDMDEEDGTVDIVESFALDKGLI